MSSHLARGPDIPALLNLLAASQLRYVLVGSVAAAVYGAAVQPGDLDVVPDRALDNLQRLAGLLRELEATPTGEPGSWIVDDAGERHWVADAPDPAAPHSAIVGWQPDPRRIDTLDHLFATRHGNFDVVPEISGRYEDLMRRAAQREVGGQHVWVAHVDDLLATLTVPRRPKDRERVQALRAWQSRQAERE